MRVQILGGAFPTNPWTRKGVFQQLVHSVGVHARDLVSNVDLTVQNKHSVF